MARQINWNVIFKSLLSIPVDFNIISRNWVRRPYFPGAGHVSFIIDFFFGKKNLSFFLLPVSGWLELDRWRISLLKSGRRPNRTGLGRRYAQDRRGRAIIRTRLDNDFEIVSTDTGTKIKHGIYGSYWAGIFKATYFVRLFWPYEQVPPHDIYIYSFWLIINQKKEMDWVAYSFIKSRPMDECICIFITKTLRTSWINDSI